MRIEHTRFDGTATMPYHCARCGLVGEAELAGSTELMGHGHGAPAGAQALTRHFHTVLGLARCPGCKRRSGDAIVRLVAVNLAKGGLVAILLGFVFLMMKRGDTSLGAMDVWLAAGGGLALALYGILRTLRATRGVFIDPTGPGADRDAG